MYILNGDICSESDSGDLGSDCVVIGIKRM